MCVYSESKHASADMGIRMKTNHNRLYGLNLSRCLGDRFLKNEDLGLSAEPYVSGVLRFNPAQRGVALLASDGLWDVMDLPAAMQVGLCFSVLLLCVSQQCNRQPGWSYLTMPMSRTNLHAPARLCNQCQLSCLRRLSKGGGQTGTRRAVSALHTEGTLMLLLTKSGLRGDRVVSSPAAGGGCVSRLWPERTGSGRVAARPGAEAQEQGRRLSHRHCLWQGLRATADATEGLRISSTRSLVLSENLSGGVYFLLGIRLLCYCVAAAAPLCKLPATVRPPVALSASCSWRHVCSSMACLELPYSKSFVSPACDSQRQTRKGYVSAGQAMAVAAPGGGDGTANR